ncbi:MAG: hypothetical protein U5R31_08050 [Acidimicrobiia bacterium]|nr:hypothetical protein [Acidimicrobiia bacterium]
MVGETVVETREDSSVVEALAIVDEGLSRLQGRELVSANEVADLLLDVRTVLDEGGSTLTDEMPLASN